MNETLSKIDKYLTGERIDEATPMSMSNAVKENEYSNISTGIKRIQFRLDKANTPQKFVDAFEMVNRLVEKFPLKTKAIWQAVADAYTMRYGSNMSAAEQLKIEKGTFTEQE
jgi:hypothetical protein